MTVLRFFEEYEGAMHFVQWLREQQERFSNMRLKMTAFSKYDEAEVKEATFFGDSLVDELEDALEALCKIKAAASLRRDLRGDDDERS